MAYDLIICEQGVVKHAPSQLTPGRKTRDSKYPWVEWEQKLRSSEDVGAIKLSFRRVEHAKWTANTLKANRHRKNFVVVVKAKDVYISLPKDGQ